jgi:cell division protein FtsL
MADRVEKVAYCALMVIAIVAAIVALSVVIGHLDHP